MSKRPLPDGPTSGNPANIRLEVVNPIWLCVSDTERYLLLEDPETGDVLIPLIYMKALLEANYSRKLASLKHRVVSIPPGSTLSDREGQLYWQWAFESPHNVKVVVRKELGEENTPQGHLRVVLLPIVYNAMSQKAFLRTSGLFKELHRAMKLSSYFPLLRYPPAEFLTVLDAEIAQDTPSPPLFHGPHTVEASASKYMFMFKDQEEAQDLQKRPRARPQGHDGLLGGDASSNSAAHLSTSDRIAHNAVAGYSPPPLGRGTGAGAAPSGLVAAIAAKQQESLPQLGLGLRGSGEGPSLNESVPWTTDVQSLTLELQVAKEELAIVKRCLIQLCTIVMGTTASLQAGGPGGGAGQEGPIPAVADGHAVGQNLPAPLASTYQRPGSRGPGPGHVPGDGAVTMAGLHRSLPSVSQRGPRDGALLWGGAPNLAAQPALNPLWQDKTGAHGTAQLVAANFSTCSSSRPASTYLPMRLLSDGSKPSLGDLQHIVQALAGDSWAGYSGTGMDMLTEPELTSLLSRLSQQHAPTPEVIPGLEEAMHGGTGRPTAAAAVDGRQGGGGLLVSQLLSLSQQLPYPGPPP